jgi:YfiR/HmsC-like
MKHVMSALLALVWLCAPIARAESEYDVKAAYLFKFTKFIEWPATAFAGPDAPFVIGIVGRDPFNGGLDRLIEGNTTGARRLEVQHLNANDSTELRGCQMVFVSASEQRRLPNILSAVQGRPVLVVGESEGFASAGGMLGFALRESRVGIEINSAAARQARLKISSQLLNLAKLVN